MSANIYWRQVKPKDGTSLNVSAPSYFMGVMERAFGSFPCTLTEEHIPVLTGLAATIDRDDRENPYQELIKAIQQYENVEVFAVY